MKRRDAMKGDCARQHSPRKAEPLPFLPLRPYVAYNKKVDAADGILDRKER